MVERSYRRDIEIKRWASKPGVKYEFPPVLFISLGLNDGSLARRPNPRNEMKPGGTIQGWVPVTDRNHEVFS